ncbi:MAG TPA: hypothetical protein VE915_05340 [Actinomycetota bacterium]|nr:hypothetical protein [Actinomycetota bacterium]
MEAAVRKAIEIDVYSSARPPGRRLLVHSRAPVAIAALLSLSFFGGLQILLVMARNTVTFVPVSAPAQVVRPDLTSPPIRTVPSVPAVPAEVAPPAPTQLSVVAEASAPALVPVADPAPGPVGGADPVEVIPKPAPVGPPPVETAPVQPPPPVVVVPEVPVPVTVPPVTVQPVTSQSGATSKPPKSSMPLSSASRPSSMPLPPASSSAAPPAATEVPEDD